MEMAIDCKLPSFSPGACAMYLARGISQVAGAALSGVSRLLPHLFSWGKAGLVRGVQVLKPMVHKGAHAGGHLLHGAMTHPLAITAFAISSVVLLLFSPGRGPVLHLVKGIGKVSGKILRVVAKSLKGMMAAVKGSASSLKAMVLKGATRVFNVAKKTLLFRGPILHLTALAALVRCVFISRAPLISVAIGAWVRVKAHSCFAPDKEAKAKVKDEEQEAEAWKARFCFPKDLFQLNQCSRIGNLGSAALTHLACTRLLHKNPTLCGLMLGYQLVSMLVTLPVTAVMHYLRGRETAPA